MNDKIRMRNGDAILMMVFIAVILLVIGCGNRNTDADLRRQLIGTWYRTNAMLVFNPDGSGISAITNGDQGWTFQMTWAVTNGSVYSTIIDANGSDVTAREAIGNNGWIKVISISDHQLVYEWFPTNIVNPLRFTLTR